VHVTLAATRDGRVLGVKGRFVCDVGAYSLYPLGASLEPSTAGATLPGPYRIPAYAYEALAVVTNKCPTGAYRGVGWVMATFVRERLLDMLARRTGLDPVELRRRNFIRTDEFPYQSPSGVVIDSLSLEATTAKLLEVAGYEDLRRMFRAQKGPRYRGIGVCVYMEPTATGSATFSRRGVVAVPGFDAAKVQVDPSGDVRAYVSAASQGQGHRTALAQILADEPTPVLTVAARSRVGAWSSAAAP
jgi:aerobic carbon-monoxide dehydrogenase large subunit